MKDNSLSTEFSHFKHLQLGQSKRTARTAAVEFIPEDSVVLDLSCGTMSLEPKLTEGCKYIPCDTVKRDTRTLICNPNEEILPESNDATIVVALGLLEYIKDVATFFKNLKEMCGLPVVLSYHPADNVPLLYRIELDWINHLKKEELILMLQHAGYNIEKGRQIDENQILLRAKPNPSKSEL